MAHPSNLMHCGEPQLMKPSNAGMGNASATIEKRDHHRAQPGDQSTPSKLSTSANCTRTENRDVRQHLSDDDNHGYMPINSMQGSQHARQPTATRSNSMENSLANGTITIVREKCKTLVLKLRTPSRGYFGFGGVVKPESDIVQVIDELGNDLTNSVVEYINDIRREVKKACPSADDPNYEVKVDVYKNLLECVTRMISAMTKVFDESLTRYRLSVEQLWNDLKNADGKQIDVKIDQFYRNSEVLFSDAVRKCIDPYLTTIESKLNIAKQ